MELDRTRITQVGLNARDVAQSVLISLSGSFQTAPNFWLNPKNGVTYQMAVQSPQYRMTSLDDLMAMPVNSQQGSQVLGNLVQLQPVVRPAVVNHYNVQPVIDVYASTQDRDLGGVAAATDKIIKDFEATCRAERASSSAARSAPCARPSSAWASGCWVRFCWCIS